MFLSQQWLKKLEDKNKQFKVLIYVKLNKLKWQQLHTDNM